MVVLVCFLLVETVPAAGGKRKPLQRNERQQLDAETPRLQRQVRKVRGARGLGATEGASDAVVLAVIGWANAGTGGTVVFIMRQVQQRQQAEVGGSVVRAVGLMQGNTEMDGCGGSNNASRKTVSKTAGGKAKVGWVCVWCGEVMCGERGGRVELISEGCVLYV